MTRDELNRIFRRALVGVAAAPLLLLPGCGRSLPYEGDGPVIPSIDAGPDAGPFDAGPFDAGHDAGVDGGWIAKITCTGGVDGGFPLSVCQSLCKDVVAGQPVIGCAPMGDILLCSTFCGVGRLADGVSARSKGDGLGKVLADMAAHEAAAVIAFEQLAIELRAHGLHRGFHRGARRAAREEQRHLQLVGALAAQRQGTFALARRHGTSVRTIDALAHDNAVEGCVRETFGSLLGAYQATHATDAGVRQVMATVTADEVGHGAYSWELTHALESRLPLARRRRVRETREHALHTLPWGMLDSIPRKHHAALGLPDEEQLEAMAGTLRSQLL